MFKMLVAFSVAHETPIRLPVDSAAEENKVSHNVTDYCAMHI